MRGGFTTVTCAMLAALAGCRSDDSPTVGAAAESKSVEDDGPRTALPASNSSTRSATARWCVTGRVTDGAGMPLADVEITAHCGSGTLRRTGRAATTETGDYTLWFGPGVLFQEGHSGLQAATIAPHKAGWIERNLHRQGDLRMATRPPEEKELQHGGPAAVVVYPGEPHRVDFVMVPAATIVGRLLDDIGRPLTNHDVWLDADELPPSSSVLASATTDDEGHFRFSEAPAGPVWLAVRSPLDRRDEALTKTLTCEAGRVCEVELVYVAGPPPRVELRRIPAR